MLALIGGNEFDNVYVLRVPGEGLLSPDGWLLTQAYK